jgi:uncharacterized membrane protein
MTANDLRELIPLGLVIALAFPIAGIASIVALSRSSSARSRLDAIDMRLAALEAMGVRREARLSATEIAGHGGAGSAEAPPAAPSPPAVGPPPARGPKAHDGASAAVTAAEAPAAGAAALASKKAPALQHPAPLVSVGNTASASPPPGERALPASVPPILSPPPAGPGLEEQFGTRWVVWIGGLALALGGIFLVRYSIEQGWIGPPVRIALGALLGVALVGAGEWLRRQESGIGLAGLPTAHIPSILTAAGTTVSYATVFAAYDLYGFIGPAAAFILLGIVALATLAAALLHGPALAALGLVGAEATPLLVASNMPNYWALYIYLAVVTAAAFVLARVRLWRWLAITAVGFGLFWALPGIADAQTGAVVPHVFHAAAGFALAALVIVAGVFFGPDAEPGRLDAISSGAVAAYLLVAALLVVASNHDPAALLPFALLVAATTAIAWRSDAAAAGLPAGALLAVLIIIAWAVEPEMGHLVASGSGSGLAPQPSEADIALHFWLGAFFAGLFGVTGYLAQGRSHGHCARAEIPLIWTATAVVAPLAILIALYYRIHGLERSLLFSAIALGLGAWFAFAAEQLGKRDPQPGVPAAAALHAAGAAASLTLALAFALEKGWLTVGLALMAPGIAWVALKRPLPLLRWIVAVVAVLVLARVVWEPRIVGDDLGTTPLFNWLLYGYGAPASAFWVAGHLLRQRVDDVPSRTLDAAAILFTVLFAVLEIRHAMNSGDIYAASHGLGEIALQVSVGLAIAIGLEWLRVRSRNVVHDVAALIIAAMTSSAGMIALFGAENPRLTGEPVGGLFLNLILLGYGLPAGLAITLALIARHTRPMPYRMAAAAISVLLALAYLTLETMRLYHGPRLVGPISDPENYTFSAVWLVFAVGLLTVGLLLDSKPSRIASAAVIGLTTAKVFLIDMAGLAGIWRALSFIGLGLVLVGIGYLYQHLLFPRRQPTPSPHPASGGG